MAGIAGLLVVVLAAAFLVVRSGDLADRAPGAAGLQSASRPAAPNTPSAAGANPRVAIQELLAKRAEAVLDGDRAAFLATVDKRQRRFYGGQRTLFNAMRTVPFSAFSYDIARLERPLSPPPGSSAGKSYEAQVEVRYRFEGQDASPVLSHDSFAFVETRSGWRIAGSGDASLRRRNDVEIWHGGPVKTVRSGRTLIVYHDGQGELAGRLLRAADRAYTQVAATWTGGWERKAVILVPRNETEAEKLVGARDLSRVAAVASSSVESGSVERVLGNRIVVNSSNVVRYDPLNLQVLVTHEMTHVATRTLGDGVPLLLVEGFADYTALKPVRLPFEVTHQALANRRFDGRLPRNDNDFRSRDAPVAYDEGSSFCQWVAGTFGSRRLQTLYREFRGSDSPSRGELDRGFRKVLRISYATAERRWAAWVREQLAS